MAFEKATRRNAWLRLAIGAPAGGGKTFSAILLAKILAALVGSRVALMDSERGSASKYAQKDGTPEGPGNWDFDVEQLEEKNPQSYLHSIADAAAAGYRVLVIDSYSHSWLGALETIDKMGGWVRGGKVVSPLVAKVVDAILSYPGHVICTMRQKSEHVIEKDERTGKMVPRKVGMASVARDGTEFEFDVMLELTTEGTVTVTKTRCSALAGQVYTWGDLPKIATILAAWLSEGAPITAEATLADSIRFAQTDAALSSLRDALQALKTSDPEAFKRLRPLYMARRAEFQGAAE